MKNYVGRNLRIPVFILLCVLALQLGAERDIFQLTRSLDVQPTLEQDNSAYVGTMVYVLSDPELLLHAAGQAIVGPTEAVVFKVVQPTMAAGPNDIMVAVFRDYNGDGVRQATEPLVPGLTATAYDAGNGQAAIDNSSTDGNYLLTIGVGAGTHRVEITDLPSYLQPGSAGSTTVFFAGPNQTVEVALVNPGQYSQDNPDLITTCFVEGPQPSSTDETLIGFGFDSGCFDAGVNGSCDDGGSFNGPMTAIATAQQIGSTFGLAQQRSTQSVYVAAFMKRHAGFASNGESGSIYRIQNPLSGSPTIVEYIDFDALGIPTKPAAPLGDPHPADNAGQVAWELDNNSWDWVGKMSFGDLDISEDEQDLYVVNLFDRRLYRFPAKPTPYTAADAGLITAIDLPRPCGADVDARPFGLGVYDGLVYFSMVCTGESTIGGWAGGKRPANSACDFNTAPAGDRTALSGKVYTYDPVSGTVNSTPVLDFPLNFGRGFAINSGYGPTSAAWNPWVTNWTVFNRPPRIVPTGPFSTETIYAQDRSYPQPILSDIEFDNGNMILGFRDRFGDQTGHLQQPPSAFTINQDPMLPNSTPPTNPNLYDGVAEGDILRACGNPATGWTLESGGDCGGISGGTPHGPNSNGPGGGEYYGHDDYTDFHNEIAQGGMVQVPGEASVATIVTDPINDLAEFYDAGIVWYENATGERVQNYLVFSTAVDVGDDDGPTFAKANGLGDMDALSDATPLQVGNRVWFDVNDDGIQNADEPGINGVSVQLWKDIGGTMTQVATTTTAADAVQGDGAFKFSNSSEQSWTGGQTEVLPNMDYEIRVSLASVMSQMATVTAFTTQDAGGDSSNDNQEDLSDSDADNMGVIAFTTGNRGENNHTLDIGAVSVVMCSVVGTIDNEVCDDNMGSVTTTDDTYDITVTATVTNGSGAYDVLVDGVEAVGGITSGTSTTISVPAGGSAVAITFRDATDDGCVSVAVNSSVLDPCSPCDVVGTIDNEVCDDNMGSTDPSDDTYDITVTATVSNGSGAYDVLVDGVEATANISSGTSTTINVPAGGSAVAITFRDATDDSCVSAAVNSSVLDPCSAPPPCMISVVSTFATPCVPATNTYSLSVEVIYENAPVGELITISTSTLASMSFTPAGVNGTETFTLTEITADGVADIDVTATYSMTNTCTNTAAASYDAPPACTGCPDGNCGGTTVTPNVIRPEE